MSANTPKTTFSKFNRRDSIASGSKIARSSRFEDASDLHFKHMQENAVSAQDLAGKIKNLYNASFICVMNTTTINANKNSNMGVKNKKIGRLPDYFYPPWIDGEENTGRSTFDEPNNKFFED